VPQIGAPLPLFLNQDRTPNPLRHDRATPAQGFPSASNTGVPVGTSLTAHPGVLSTSANNQVIDALDITGGVYISHTNVIVRRCKITGNGGFDWAIENHGTGTLIEDCTLDSNQSTSGALWGDQPFTIRRCNISNGENAVRPESNCVIQDNWMHSFVSSDSAPHYDGVEMLKGNGTVIRHNTITLDQGQTSTINLQGTDAAITNTVVDNNLLSGGGWIVNIRSIGAFPVSGTQLTGNRFVDTGNLGPGAVDSGTCSLVSGNVWDVSGINVDSQL